MFLLLREVQRRLPVSRLRISLEPSSHEQLAQLGGTFRGGEVKPGPAVVVDEIDGCSAVEHGHDGCDAPRLARFQQPLPRALPRDAIFEHELARGALLPRNLRHRLALHRARECVRGGGEQRAGALFAPRDARRAEERGPARLVHAHDVAPLLQQHVHHGIVPARAREHQGRDAVVVRRVHRGALAQEHGRDGVEPLLGRHVEGGEALVVGVQGVRAVVEASLHPGLVAALDRLHELIAARHRAVRNECRL